MTLRQKFLTALVGMVFFMAIIFATISLSSISSLVSHSSNYISQSYTQQLERSLIYYYQQHKNWAGVQEYIQSITGTPNQKSRPILRGNDHILVFDSNKNLVGGSVDEDPRRKIDQSPIGSQITDQWHAILVEGQIVGYYWIDEKLIIREGYLARGIASYSIIRGLLVGLVVTSLTALVLGIVLTRRLTVPLKRLTEAVKSVGQGDLSQCLEIKGKDEIASLGGAFNRMAEQLSRNEEVRRNMVADIAHELRTPLSVILGKLESIQEGILPQSPEALLPIQDETIRLIRLVRDLQQLSLAEAGKLPLRFQAVDLRQLMTKIFEQFAYEFEERKLKAEITGRVPLITADTDRLTQVFVNLVGNALLHTPAGGTIRVTLEEGNPWRIVETAQHPQVSVEKQTVKQVNLPSKFSLAQRSFLGFWTPRNPGRAGQRKGSEADAEIVAAEGWIRIVIEDTGVGIPETELEHIFDRFYRVTKARERETGGTGLGLSIAKEFVQAHGGQISVQSTVDVGTCFTIWLRKDQGAY
ncbi:MAG: ATP-binding protein [Desulfitobacteriaceae bacterium]